MIFAPILQLLTALLNTLYAGLPPWTFSFNDGAGDLGQGGLDGGGFLVFIQFLGIWDRWIPIHDFLIPCFSINFAIMAGLLAIKVIKFGISCIPTISGGG